MLVSLALALPLVALGAIGVNLERAVDLPLEDALESVRALASALEKRSGAPVRVDDPLWRCETDDRCLAAIRSRLSADTVILLRVYGGPRKKMRLVADRMDAGDKIAAHAELDVPRDAADRPALYARFAAELVPAPESAFHSMAFQDAPLAPTDDSLRAGSSAWPWVLIGSGVALAGAGFGFGASSAGAKSSLEARIHGDREYESLSDRERAHGVAADVLWIAGGAAALAGATWLFLDHLER